MVLPDILAGILAVVAFPDSPVGIPDAAASSVPAAVAASSASSLAAAVVRNKPASVAAAAVVVVPVLPPPPSAFSSAFSSSSAAPESPAAVAAGVVDQLGIAEEVQLLRDTMVSFARLLEVPGDHPDDTSVAAPFRTEASVVPESPEVPDPESIPAAVAVGVLALGWSAEVLAVAVVAASSAVVEPGPELGPELGPEPVAAGAFVVDTVAVEPDEPPAVVVAAAELPRAAACSEHVPVEHPGTA